DILLQVLVGLHPCLHRPLPQSLPGLALYSDTGLRYQALYGRVLFLRGNPIKMPLSNVKEIHEITQWGLWTVHLLLLGQQALDRLVDFCKRLTPSLGSPGELGKLLPKGLQYFAVILAPSLSSLGEFGKLLTQSLQGRRDFGVILWCHDFP